MVYYHVIELVGDGLSTCLSPSFYRPVEGRASTKPLEVAELGLEAMAHTCGEASS